MVDIDASWLLHELKFMIAMVSTPHGAKGDGMTMSILLVLGGVVVPS